MQRGWPHFEVMQGIMFSTAARGTHVFRPTQAPAQSSSATTAADEDGPAESVTSAGNIISSSVATVINQITESNAMSATGLSISTMTGSSVASAAGSSIVAVAGPGAQMDIDDPSTLLPPQSSNKGKRPHSTIMLDDASTSHSPSVPPSDNPPRKKSQKGSRIAVSDPHPLGSHISRSVRDTPDSQSSKVGKVTQAAAMVGMQSQLGRLTDVFEKSMMTSQDSATTATSLALARVQEIDDGLSMDEKVKLVRLFHEDFRTAQVYLDLVHEDLRKAWLASILHPI